jgi:hypothetical protein
MNGTIATRQNTTGAPGAGATATARSAGTILSLAAAPTFAAMALLTGPHDMLCSSAQDASLLSGMVPMYLLMSAFHSAPWLKLASSRRSGTCRRPAGRR